jgi:hypothetical protein
MITDFTIVLNWLVMVTYAEGFFEDILYATSVMYGYPR